MKVCTIHEPPAPAADRVDHADQLMFVRDGFSWGAALFAPFWMLAHRLWLVLLAYVAGTLALRFALVALGVDAGWIALVLLAINVALGFEAASLIRWTLERRGWKYLGAVAGRSIVECERRFFEAWLPHQPLVRPDGLSRAPRGGDAGAPGARWSGAGRLSRWRRG
jgi:hypothetical protein